MTDFFLIVLRTTGLRAWRGAADRFGLGFGCGSAASGSSSVRVSATCSDAGRESTAVAVSVASVCFSGRCSDLITSAALLDYIPDFD